MEKWKDKRYYNKFIKGELPMKKQEETESITLIKNIPYCESIRGENPALDAWLPVKPGKILPACLLLHGGGWTTGDKGDERERNMAKKLCKMGYAAFSANYHMALYEEGPYRGKVPGQNALKTVWKPCLLSEGTQINSP